MKTAAHPIEFMPPVLKLLMVREPMTKKNLPITMNTATDAETILRTYLEQCDREHFVVVLLTAKNEVLGINIAHVGTINMCVVSPREVFKPAIIGNASHIIVGHNHPSGDPTPSPEDVKLTRKLREVGELLDIPVIDHIIIGSNGTYKSLAKEGLL